MPRVFIGLGSNLGDRRGHLLAARDQLAQLPRTGLIAFSDIYETAPVGPVEQGAFLNAAAELDTQLPPAELLEHLQRVEASRGRPPRHLRQHWGPRQLDLDILFYGGDRITLDQLTIPHPRLHERWFVLKPLHDLAPDFTHPALKKTIAELLAALPPT